MRVEVTYTDGQGTEEIVASDQTDPIADGGEIEIVEINGEAFIQGTFVELGISANGTIGTAGAAPETFNSSSESPLANGEVGLSFYADDGVGIRDTGDAFLPGTVVENFTVAYTVGGTSSTATNQASANGTDIPMSLASTSVDGDTAAATTSGGIAGTLDISQTVSLGADDTYYTTTVTITNTSGQTLSGLRYMRNNDPDQGQPITGDFGTSNDVLSNPDDVSNNRGFAAVDARSDDLAGIASA